MVKIIHKIIEDQIKTWEHGSSDKKELEVPNGQPYPVITISREFGARGAALAALLGEKTGFKVWDRDILQTIADRLGCNRKFVESLDESRREMIEDAFMGFMKNVNTNVNYLRTLNRVIKTIERRGNAIIVGRGANYICRNPYSFHLRIVSPLEKRAVDYAARERITKHEALAIMKQTDAERSEFVRYYFKKDISEPSQYDLVLNSGTFSLQKMMAIVIEAYEQKSGLKLKILN